MKLVNAGYTKSEIEQMQEPEPQPEPQQDQQPEPQQEPEPETQTEPQPDTNQLQELKNELTKTQKQLSDLVRQMQQNNLRTASVNILPENDLDKKTDMAMSELIRPSIQKEVQNNVG